MNDLNLNSFKIYSIDGVVIENIEEQRNHLNNKSPPILYAFIDNEEKLEKQIGPRSLKGKINFEQGDQCPQCNNWKLIKPVEYPGIKEYCEVCDYKVASTVENYLKAVCFLKEKVEEEIEEKSENKMQLSYLLN